MIFILLFWAVHIVEQTVRISKAIGKLFLLAMENV